MINSLLAMALSNAIFAFGIALVALLVGLKLNRPQLAHGLWILVFIKLVTPPLVSVPWPEKAATIEAAVTPLMVPERSIERPALLNGPRFNSSASTNVPSETLTRQDQRLHEAGLTTISAKYGLVLLWLSGSAVILVWSLSRMRAFNRLLAKHAAPVPTEVYLEAHQLSKRLGLERVPKLCLTKASLSPMVWWTGRDVQVVLPEKLMEQLPAHEWRWVVAHELAHIRRNDHLVRWLEWLACVIFWWNPLTWWAQRNLRALEEICCDALVLQTFEPKSHTYASSIFSAVASLVRLDARAPMMASEINSGGFLERRFRMIVAERGKLTNSVRASQTTVLVVAALLLPLGIGCGVDLSGASLTPANGDSPNISASLFDENDELIASVSSEQSDPNDPNEVDELHTAIEFVLNLGQQIELDGLSEEDAFSRIREQFGELEEEYEELAALALQLGQEVAAGIITEEDAWEEIHRYLEGDLEAELEYLLELGQLVEAGELTLDEAIARVEEDDEREEDDLEFARWVLELGMAVGSGEISEEEAWQKIEEEIGEFDEEFSWIEEILDLAEAVEEGSITRDEALEFIEAEAGNLTVEDREVVEYVLDLGIALAAGEIEEFEVHEAIDELIEAIELDEVVTWVLELGAQIATGQLTEDEAIQLVEEEHGELEEEWLAFTVLALDVGGQLERGEIGEDEARRLIENELEAFEGETNEDLDFDYDLLGGYADFAEALGRIEGHIQLGKRIGSGEIDRAAAISVIEAYDGPLSDEELHILNRLIDLGVEIEAGNLTEEAARSEVEAIFSELQEDEHHDDHNRDDDEDHDQDEDHDHDEDED